MNSLKRTSDLAGFDQAVLHDDLLQGDGVDSDSSSTKDEKSSNDGTGSRPGTPQPRYGKKTRGRVKINMEFIDNKLRRYTTFSKRKSGIMKKAHELATLTGTQVMLLVASETGHVYTFATRKLQPILSSDAGKQLIQTCLNSPDPNEASAAASSHDEQRMSAQGFEEPDLSYAPGEDTKEGLLQKTYHILNAISAQQTEQQSPQKDSDVASPSEQRQPELTPMNLVSGMNTEETQMHSGNQQPPPTFALVPGQPVAASSHYDVSHHLQFNPSNGVRMRMVPVVDTHVPLESCSPTPQSSSQEHHSIHNTSRSLDGSRISFVNSYNQLSQRNQPGYKPDDRQKEWRRMNY